MVDILGAYLGLAVALFIQLLVSRCARQTNPQSSIPGSTMCNCWYFVRGLGAVVVPQLTDDIHQGFRIRAQYLTGAKYGYDNTRR